MFTYTALNKSRVHHLVEKRKHLLTRVVNRIGATIIIIVVVVRVVTDTINLPVIVCKKHQQNFYKRYNHFQLFIATNSISLSSLSIIIFVVAVTIVVINIIVVVVIIVSRCLSLDHQVHCRHCHRRCHYHDSQST